MENKNNRDNVRAELDLMREYINTMKKSDIFTDADNLLIYLDNIDTYMSMDVATIFEKMKHVDFGESMCDETKLKVLKWALSQPQQSLPTKEQAEIREDSWISVEDRLPEDLETVWLSNGEGWTTLGCWVYDADGWYWASSNGEIYQEDGKIVSECEGDDYDVKFWHSLPIPINNPNK